MLFRSEENAQGNLDQNPISAIDECRQTRNLEMVDERIAYHQSPAIRRKLTLKILVKGAAAGQTRKLQFYRRSLNLTASQSQHPNNYRD